MTDEMFDPEQSYRRGYSQGAWDVIEALEKRLLPSEFQRLKDWFQQVEEWQLQSMRGSVEKTTPPRAGLGRVLSN